MEKRPGRRVGRVVVRFPGSVRHSRGRKFTANDRLYDFGGTVLRAAKPHRVVRRHARVLRRRGGAHLPGGRFDHPAAQISTRPRRATFAVCRTTRLAEPRRRLGTFMMRLLDLKFRTSSGCAFACSPGQTSVLPSVVAQRRGVSGRVGADHFARRAQGAFVRARRRG